MCGRYTVTTPIEQIADLFEVSRGGQDDQLPLPEMSPRYNLAPTQEAPVVRVLEPGGRFAVYEQMRTGEGPLTYPLPWAEDESSSFVERRERYADLLATAGFVVERDEDRTAANAPPGPPAPGALTPAALFGPGFGERIRNNLDAAAAGTLSAVLMVARAV